MVTPDKEDKQLKMFSRNLMSDEDLGLFCEEYCYYIDRLNIPLKEYEYAFQMMEYKPEAKKIIKNCRRNAFRVKLIEKKIADTPGVSCIIDAHNKIIYMKSVINQELLEIIQNKAKVLKYQIQPAFL